MEVACFPAQRDHYLIAERVGVYLQRWGTGFPFRHCRLQLDIPDGVVVEIHYVQAAEAGVQGDPSWKIELGECAGNEVVDQ